MSRWDTRSSKGSRRNLRTRTLDRVGRLLGAAGGAGSAGEDFAGLEALENRVLLGGDHPSFSDFPAGTTIDIDGTTGVGTVSGGDVDGVISPEADDDVFTFTAPSDDFVTVWADTINAAQDLGDLDSRVEIYRQTVSGAAELIGAGSNNGLLTGGLNSDGWAGFIAEAGRQYWVRVLGDTISGAGALGRYKLRVDAISSELAGGSDLNPTTGLGSANGSIATVGGDTVYVVRSGSGAGFDSLATANGTTPGASTLDTRLEIYDTAASLIVNDSETGFLSNAFTTWRSGVSQTFYVRIRSDQFSLVSSAATGSYSLKIDGLAETIVIDPVMRLGSTGTTGPAGKDITALWHFKTEGTGLSFVTLVPSGLVPIPDPAVRLYTDQPGEPGKLIAFNDDFAGVSAQINILLQGGKEYWVVVEDFDDGGSGTYNLLVEAHHTFDGAVPVDDHVNTPGAGLDAAVRRREFERATPLRFGDPLPVRGDQDGSPMTPAENLADHSNAITAVAEGRIWDAGDTDLFMFTAPLDMLSQWVGKDDGGTPDPVWLWDRRPSSLMQIITSGTAGSFLNTFTTVYDSNFNVIWTNETIAPPFPDPSGMLDPAAFNPPYLPESLHGIPIWGGEVYYIEVSGSGTGRYAMSVTVDGMKDDTAQDGDHPDTIIDDAPTDTPTTADKDAGAGFGEEWIYSYIFETPGEGHFAEAIELGLSNPTGDGRNFTSFPFDGYDVRGLDKSLQDVLAGYNPFAGVGMTFVRGGDLGNISTIKDTDMFFFRARGNGFAEIRLNTTALADQWFEQIIDGDVDPMNPVITTNTLTKTYNSMLDGMLTIFNNDLQQIAINDNNYAIGGESDTTNVGEFGGRTFFRRDPRVVIPVEDGKVYYILVSSAQRAAFLAGLDDKVDWRHANGSYEVLINAMPDLASTFPDDHVNASGPQSTPVAVDDVPGSPSNGTGSAAGRVLNTPANPDDADLFNFIAPGDGTATVTITPVDDLVTGDPATLLADVQIFSASGALVTQAQADSVSPTTLQFDAKAGDRFFIRVAGVNGLSEGYYSVAISGVPAEDDAASVSEFGAATALTGYDFTGFASMSGTIEATGDTDIFSFETTTYDTVTVSVQSSATSLNPQVRIYEVREDGALVGLPHLTEIASAAGTGGATTATITFSITAPDRTSGSSGRTYNTYYIVVSGVNPETDKGAYTLDFSITPTDDHPDAGEFDLASGITVEPSTGLGDGTGNLELSGDTDLFQFTTQGQGDVFITVTSPAESTLLPRVRVFDAEFNPVADVSLAEFVDGPDASVSAAVFTFTGTRNTLYYVLVEGVAGGSVKTTDSGTYTVHVDTATLDDHANAGEFAFATIVDLSRITGDATVTGLIGSTSATPRRDTDLFALTAIIGTGTADDDIVVTVGSGAGLFVPSLRLFRADFTEIGTAVVDGGAGDLDPAAQSVQRRITGVTAGDVFYVLVEPDASGPSFGAYTARFDGPEGPDDFTDAGDFAGAAGIALGSRTGDGSIGGLIETPSDSDLFTFTSAAGGKAYVQIITPLGLLLDVGVKVYGPGQTQIAGDTAGIPGANAATSFNIGGAGEQYWIEVDGLGSVTGSYTVLINTQPAVSYLYFPEGWASNTIREYVSVANPNTFDALFDVTLYYEDGGAPSVIASNRLIRAGARSGITISNAGGALFLDAAVRQGVGYSIVITSRNATAGGANGSLAATISHYDKQSTLGEAFTEITSGTWSFGRAERFPDSVDDYILVYNPSNVGVRVTFTAYPASGSPVVMTLDIAANARGGWRLKDYPQLPTGAFGVVLTSAPLTTPGTPDDYVGIVASLSHYDVTNGAGYAVMGDPSGGSTVGVVPNVSSGAGVTTTITVLNSGSTAAQVNIRGSYVASGLPDLVRAITVGPGTFVTLTGASLGLVPNQAIGIEWDADQPITVLASQAQKGDADAIAGAGSGATAYYFGDGFMNASQAGILYFETLSFFNADASNLAITIQFFFTDGTSATESLSVGGRDFAALDLHKLTSILSKGNAAYYSIGITADRAFVASLTHYDLVLAGGWTTIGAPVGITNPLSTIG